MGNVWIRYPQDIEAAKKAILTLLSQQEMPIARNLILAVCSAPDSTFVRKDTEVALGQLINEKVVGLIEKGPNGERYHKKQYYMLAEKLKDFRWPEKKTPWARATEIVMAKLGPDHPLATEIRIALDEEAKKGQSL